MVEQRRHLVFEQRQPVFHPRETAAVRNRLIERVAGRGRAEAFAVTAAEALDAVLVEQRFGCGQEGEAVDAAGGALVARIEGAHALDLVAGEIEPQCVFLAARKQSDPPAAPGDTARDRQSTG